MCPVCATTAALTAATATTSATVLAAWGIALSEPIVARWRALKTWLLEHLGGIESLGAQDEQ